MYYLKFTEEEIAIILQAIQKYEYDNIYITEEQFNIAENVIAKIDEVI